jgi:hypothetical protein
VLHAGGNYSCLQLLGSRKVLVDLKHRPEPYEFNFDWILPEAASQLDVFEGEARAAAAAAAAAAGGLAVWSGLALTAAARAHGTGSRVPVSCSRHWYARAPCCAAPLYKFLLAEWLQVPQQQRMTSHRSVQPINAQRQEARSRHA